MVLISSFSPGSLAAVTNVWVTLLKRGLWDDSLVLGFGSDLKLSLAEPVPDSRVPWEGVKIICWKLSCFTVPLRRDLTVLVVFRLKAPLCFDNSFSRCDGEEHIPKSVLPRLVSQQYLIMWVWMLYKCNKTLMNLLRLHLSLMQTPTNPKSKCVHEKTGALWPVPCSLVLPPPQGGAGAQTQNSSNWCGQALFVSIMSEMREKGK